MKKLLLLVIIAILSCSFLVSCVNNKYVGTYECSAWVDSQGDTGTGAKLVLESNGKGRYKANEESGTSSVTWEAEGDRVYVTDSFYKSVSEYAYKVINGEVHLICNEGKMEQDLIKKE